MMGDNDDGDGSWVDIVTGVLVFVLIFGLIWVVL